MIWGTTRGCKGDTRSLDYSSTIRVIPKDSGARILQYCLHHVYGKHAIGSVCPKLTLQNSSS